jgi:hypothetical protein
VSKILNGIKILKDLDKNTPQEEAFVKYNGAMIKRSKLKAYYTNYELAVNIFIGNQIISKLENFQDLSSLESIVKNLTGENYESFDEWSDLSGMIAPTGLINNLLSEIVSGKVNTIEELTSKLKSIHDKYDDYTWGWCIDLIQKRMGINIKELSKEQLIQIIKDWKESYVKLNNMILRDAEKEFNESSRIGFGIDGDKEVRDKDFESIRGTFPDNKFVKELKTESETVVLQAQKLISKIQSL